MANQFIGTQNVKNEEIEQLEKTVQDLMDENKALVELLMEYAAKITMFEMRIKVKNLKDGRNPDGNGEH